jgi:hypothetical protein
LFIVGKRRQLRKALQNYQITVRLTKKLSPPPKQKQPKAKSWSITFDVTNLETFGTSWKRKPDYFSVLNLSMFIERQEMEKQ